MEMRFSVLIPVFNREDYIDQAIDSVLSQSFADYELIVVDDGSTDRTHDILTSYGDRIQVVRQKNQGPEVARNAGASRATGEYLAFLDSDDLFMPGALTTYDRIIRAFDAPAIILGSMVYFHHSRSFSSGPGPGGDAIEAVAAEDFLAARSVQGMSNSKIVMRRSAFDSARARQRGTAVVFPMEDHDLLLRAGTSGRCVNVIRPVTVAYRVHASNYVHNLEAMVGGTLAMVAAERQGRYPGGKARRFSRRAYIGGKVQFWIRTAIKGRRPGLALRLLKDGGPMVAAAVLRKLLGKLRPAVRPRVLSEGAVEAGPEDSRVAPGP
jgi:glycosyltransferase involved in cell wall biosynthesis